MIAMSEGDTDPSSRYAKRALNLRIWDPRRVYFSFMACLFYLFDDNRVSKTDPSTTGTEWCENCGQERGRHPVRREDGGIACDRYVEPGSDRRGHS